MIDQIINTIFFLDILVNIRTTFYGKRGEEIFDQKLIALNYISSFGFLSDFLAAFPFDRVFVTPNDAIRIFGIFKLFKFSIFNQILQKADMRDDKKALV